jgi:hypothetical protein
VLFLVDTVTVETDRLELYLDLVRARAVPIMTGAGATFCYLRSSNPGLGEPVEVQVAWSVADNAGWNEVRKNLVLDPRWYELALELAQVRVGGTRRFLRPAEEKAPAP